MPEYDSTIRYAAIPDFPGYQAGTDGSVWSARVRGSSRITNRWLQLKPRKLRTGHSKLYLVHADGRLREILTHRLILSTFVGPCPPGMECCHFPDRDPTNNRLENLRWGSNSENKADRVFHGTDARGEKSPNAKLTNEDVRTIRSTHAAGLKTLTDLARDYRVSVSAIRFSTLRLTWKDVE